MKRGRLIFFGFVLAVFLGTIVSANDVAYIYRKDFKVNQGFVEELENLGYDVDMILEKDVPSDLSNYDFILVGDDKFKDAENIPVGDYNAIVANYYHTEDWGLTDRDGASQMGSTAPLTVWKEGQEIQVYTQAFKRGRVAVPYYFLDKENKLPGVEQVASTMRTGSGHNFGDVISYVDSNSRTCFFGIIESDFWTDGARDLFDECVEFVSAGATPPQAECVVDADCGDDMLGEPYCDVGTDYEDDNVYQDVTSYVCDEGMCVPQEETDLVEDCEFGCDAGMCMPEPVECSVDLDCPADFSEGFVCENGDVYEQIRDYSCESNSCVSGLDSVFFEACEFGCFEGECLPDSSEGVHDVAFVDFSNSFGMIRLEHSDGTDILEDEDLTCGESYKISVTLENVGDFFEDVSFTGSIDGIDFSHLPISAHEPGVKKLKTKTIDFNLGEGSYPIIVEAFIDGFADENPTDNVVMRLVNVVCEDSNCEPGEICTGASGG